MLLKKIFGAILCVVLLTSSLVALFLYRSSIAEAQGPDYVEGVSDLNQIPDLQDLKIEFGASQSSIVVVAESAGGSAQINFALQEDLEEERRLVQNRGRGWVAQALIEANYQPTSIPTLSYELPNKRSASLSRPSNCQITPSLFVSTPKLDELGEVNGYSPTWSNYDLAGRSLEIKLQLPVLDKSTTDVTDDCFVITRTWQATSPSNWPLFILTGGLNTESGCRGLFVFGRGGDDLQRSPAAWVCREDVTNLGTEALDAFTAVEREPSFGRYLIFIETRDDKCGSRLLLSRDDILAGGETVRGQWQDWHDNCQDGQYDKDSDNKRSFDLAIANGATNQAVIEATRDTAQSSVSTITGNTGSVEDGCEFKLSGLGFGYIICQILEGLSGAIYWIESQIQNFLNIDRSDYQETLGQSGQFSFKDAWSNVRNFSTYAIVGTALFMVISTALDVGLFKNYTVRKYLPRLIVGAILIQFSWALGDLFIQSFNQLGDVLEAILFASFPGAKEQDLAKIFDGGAGTVIFGAAGLAYVGWAALLPVVFTGMMFFLFAFLFLVARKFIIIMLLIFAPLGIALWVLPGNDRAWNFYFKTFFYLLVMYPLIIVLISAGKIFSYLILL